MKRMPDSASLTPWHRMASFLVRQRARILFTIFVALAADSLGGKLLQHDLSEVRDFRQLMGLMTVLAGLTLLAWAAGAMDRLPSLVGSEPYNTLRDVRYVGAFISMAGFCLLIDEPRNIWLLLGPVILLDLFRERRTSGNRVAKLETRRRHGTVSAVISSLSLRRKSAATGGVCSHERDRWLRSRSYAPLLIVPTVVLAVIGYAWPFDSLEFHEVWEIRCLLLSFAGLAIRMLASGQIADSPRIRVNSQPHAMTLMTDGAYSVVRHPRYVGDYFIGLGVVLIPFVWWLPIMYTVAFALYYKRIVAIEERETRLKFGKAFDDWASATPALIPRIGQWSPASYPFSFRAALRQEHAALFVVVALHASVEWLEHLILERRVMLELFWIILAAIGLAAHLLVRHLERHTRLLNVPAR